MLVLVLVAVVIITLAVGWAWQNDTLYPSEEECVDLEFERIVRRLDLPAR